MNAIPPAAKSQHIPSPAKYDVPSGEEFGVGGDARSPIEPDGCRGRVTRAPDFNLVLTGTSRSLRMYVDGTGGGEDVTLIINRADGSWTRGDDACGTLHPSVDLPNAGPGTNNVWVGSYRQGTTVRARLNVTELASNHP